MTWLLILMACTDEVSEGPKDHPDRSNADTDDPETVDTSDLVFYEDFQDDPTELEHRYEDQSLYYYDSIDAFIGEQNGTHEFDGEGMVETEHSVVYAVGIATQNNYDEWSHAMWEDNFSPSDTFDLTACTTGQVRFTWGIDDLSVTEREITASAFQEGIGRDDSFPCEGTQELAVERDDTSTSWGPFEVVCPLDYDCGYETEGFLRIWLQVEVTCREDDECSADSSYPLGAVVWADNIGVSME